MHKVRHMKVDMLVGMLVGMLVDMPAGSMQVHMVLRRLVRMVRHSKVGRDRMTVRSWTSYGSNPPKVLLWLTKKRTRSSFPVVFSLKTPFVLSR